MNVLKLLASAARAVGDVLTSLLKTLVDTKLNRHSWCLLILFPVGRGGVWTGVQLHS